VKKISLLFIANSSRVTGPNNQLSYLLRSIDQEIFHPVVLFLSPKIKNHKLEEVLKVMKIKVIYCNGCKNNLLFLYKFYLAHLTIKKENPDIVHTSGLIPDLINGILLHKRTASVATIRSRFFNEYPIRYGRILSTIMIFIHKKSLQHIDKIVAVSSAVKENISCCELNHKKILVINNSIPDTLVKNKIFFLKIIITKSVNKNFIYVGHVDKLKNVSFIINSWGRVSSKIDKLCILGRVDSGFYNSNVDKEKIQFLGYVKDTTPYYLESNFYISASITEGHPNSVIEALFFGCVCILSDIPSHREIYNKFPEAVVLFQNNIIKSLEGAIDKSFDLSKKLNKKTFFEKVVKEYHPDKAYLMYREVYFS
jgi:glycosyltransferase involved in cell wall biosynthesis